MPLVAVAADDSASLVWLRQLRQVLPIDLAGHLHHDARGALVRIFIRREVQVIVRIHAGPRHMAIGTFHAELRNETDHHLN